MSKITETNPDEYKDYCRKRKAIRPFHRENVDTAVMGMRPKLDLPYWIHKAMCRGGYSNSWSWVFEHGGVHGPNANTTRFGQMFPEFLIITDEENEAQELRRQKMKEKDPAMRRLRNPRDPEGFVFATKYLNDRLKGIKQGVAV